MWDFECYQLQNISTSLQYWNPHSLLSSTRNRAGYIGNNFPSVEKSSTEGSEETIYTNNVPVKTDIINFVHCFTMFRMSIRHFYSVSDGDKMSEGDYGSWNMCFLFLCIAAYSIIWYNFLNQKGGIWRMVKYYSHFHIDFN